MSQHDINWLSRVYPLLNSACPALLKKLNYEFPNQAVVAANLLIFSDDRNYVSTITSDSNTKFSFVLDLSAKYGSSKGDWIWIKHVEINLDEHNLLSIPMQKRIVDIPYCNNMVSAYCLFKNFYPELLVAIERKLDI